MVPIVTEGTASMCDCAATAAAYHAMAAAIKMVATRALMTPLVVLAKWLTYARLKCKSCSHISRSIRLTNVSRAVPQIPHSHTFSSKMLALTPLNDGDAERGFHIQQRNSLMAATDLSKRHASPIRGEART